MPCWPTFEVRPALVSLILRPTQLKARDLEQKRGQGEGKHFNSPCNFLSTHCTLILRGHVTPLSCLDQGEGQFDQIANRTCSSPSARLSLV